MSFKEFSSAQDATNKANPDNKAGSAPAVKKPAASPDKAPAEGAPAAKS